MYFYGLGLRNYSLGLFGNIEITSRDGFLFQNFIFNLLHQKVSEAFYTINFWLTKDGAEVDFVLSRGLELLPIEVKLTNLDKVEIPRFIRSFITKYQPKRAWLVNLNFSSQKSQLH